MLVEQPMRYSLLHHSKVHCTEYSRVHISIVKNKRGQEVTVSNYQDLNALIKLRNARATRNAVNLKVNPKVVWNFCH